MYENFHTFLSKKGGLSPSACEQIVQDVEVKTFNKGQFLLQPGNICDCVFFVEQGLVRMFRIDADGKEHILQFGSEGWLVTDRGSMYFNEPSNYYIDAIEQTKVIILDQAFFQRTTSSYPAFRKYNDRLLHNHIRHLNNRITGLLSSSAKERYLAFIALYPNVLLRVPQWMVASYLGIKPESLSRVRKQLATQNPQRK